MNIIRMAFLWASVIVMSVGQLYGQSAANVALTETEPIIQIYPNPANEKLVVASSHMIAELSLFDNKGQRIKSVKYNDTEVVFNTEFLKPNIYYLVARTTDHHVSTHRFQKH